MRTIGCLAIVALICVGIWLLAGSQDMSDEQKAQWAGEKAHRGWNRLQQMAASAKQGWKSSPQGTQDPSAGR